MITVTAPKDIRIARVLKRDSHRSAKDIEQVMSKQMPEAEKTKMSQFVIVNDDLQLVTPQVLKIHQQLCTEIGR